MSITGPYYEYNLDDEDVYVDPDDARDALDDFYAMGDN